MKLATTPINIWVSTLSFREMCLLQTLMKNNMVVLTDSSSVVKFYLTSNKNVGEPSPKCDDLQHMVPTEAYGKAVTRYSNYTRSLRSISDIDLLALKRLGAKDYLLQMTVNTLRRSKCSLG